MNTKLLIILFALIVITIINLIIRRISCLKVRKYGIKTKAKVIGYYVYSNNIHQENNIKYYLCFKPIIEFIDKNNTKLIVKSQISNLLPLYKVGEEVTIRYYKNYKFNGEKYPAEMYINRLTTKKESVEIFKNIEFIFLDIKHNLDIIIELLIMLIILIIK